MANAIVHRHLFTVDDFARMGEAGIFTANDRVELIDPERIDRQATIDEMVRRFSPWIGSDSRGS